MAKQPPPGTGAKPGLHPRNPHRGRYDIPALLAVCPELAPFLRPNPSGEPTVDFTDPAAVRTLNRALLASVYGVRHWDLPPGYLCPPVPGRADYIHHLADLLATDGLPPRGPATRVLDVGVGAGAIYPLLGHRSYGWSFLGTDIDPGALASSRAILAANPDLEGAIQLRLQKDPARILAGVLLPGETFAASLCNPPFHGSPAEAREGTQRKWRNLGRPGAPVLNFGGRAGELWCEGGEVAFLSRLIEESAAAPQACRWFTSLLSKSSNLPPIQAALRKARAPHVRILEMAQGQKRSRIVAWSFQEPGR
ncbi:ribosomal RNA large subunit methyltransferase F [Mesoterricola silvestris]|uniref:Ribosomal RNA large subunit methyltransferase F n=2 Tax=Mesoterricola silvestris TaxID=2927979 RepID=A0AA48GTM2_9BACT|nr:23S rRNA (adenine(1618)-N(6))-methyltransferase RlmF [Mesoterricola silvestris]BDU74130.1 ribosomal RNA large subunit methyltransferase F [Mesoterricola silvestris]